MKLNRESNWWLFSAHLAVIWQAQSNKNSLSVCLSKGYNQARTRRGAYPAVTTATGRFHSSFPAATTVCDSEGWSHDSHVAAKTEWGRDWSCHTQQGFYEYFICFVYRYDNIQFDCLYFIFGWLFNLRLFSNQILLFHSLPVSVSSELLT